MSLMQLEIKISRGEEFSFCNVACTLMGGQLGANMHQDTFMMSYVHVVQLFSYLNGRAAQRSVCIYSKSITHIRKRQIVMHLECRSQLVL